jgi:hypothetical protein
MRDTDERYQLQLLRKNESYNSPVLDGHRAGNTEDRRKCHINMMPAKQNNRSSQSGNYLSLLSWFCHRAFPVQKAIDLGLFRNIETSALY